MENVDSWIKSALVGRIGAGLLMLMMAVFKFSDIDFSAEDQQAMQNMFGELLKFIGLAASSALAIYSKIRETWRRRGKGILMFDRAAIVLLVLSVFALTACNGTFLTVDKRWCDAIPEGSYSVICQAADKLGTQPEEIALGLEIADIAVLSKKVYTAKQVDNFLTDLDAAAATYQNTNTVTWKSFLNYVTTKHAGLSPEAQACLKLVMKRYNVNLPDLEAKLLSPYDWTGIRAEIANLKDLVEPFLLVQQGTS